MKRVRYVEEIEGEGLESFLGEKVLLLCANYFYVGVLEGVNDEDVMLSSPAIVYQTGEWSRSDYEDSQPLGMDKIYIMKAFIESYGAAK